MTSNETFGPCPTWCVVTSAKHLEEFESNDSKFVTHKSEVVEVETAGEPNHNWIPDTADVVMSQRIEKDDEERFKAFEPIIELQGGVENGFVLSRAVELAESLVTFSERSAEWRGSEECRPTLDDI